MDHLGWQQAQARNVVCATEIGFCINNYGAAIDLSPLPAKEIDYRLSSIAVGSEYMLLGIAIRF